MGQTAIISPQILDSTTVGRDLITAADAAAAHSVLELEDTAFTYSLTQTFEGGIVTDGITSATNLVTTLPSGGQLQYYYGANPIYLASATEFRPAEALTSVTLGSATREWANVYAVTGTYSGTVTANAFVGDGSGLTGLPGGNPFDQDLNTTDSPSFVDGSYSGNLNVESSGSQRVYNLGSEGDVDTEYLETSWDTNVAKIASVATGTGVQRGLRFGATYCEIDVVSSSGLLSLQQNGSEHYSFRYNKFLPKGSLNSKNLGDIGALWKGVYSVDGSFYGTLDTEVGGSNRLFNLGTDGAVAAGNTEYLETSWDANVATIASVATGTGVQRNIEIDAPVVIMAANVDFTGLPTADPVVAGRLWNDSGTMKISAG